MTMENDNIYRMLNVDEASELLGISEKNVRKLVEEGSLPSWRPGPMTVRIPYWLMIWRVSLENGMAMEDMVGPVTKPVTMIIPA